MDEDDFLSQRLKQADVDDPSDGDVDTLIGTALRRGRRRVLVRRAAGVVAVCAVLTVVGGLGISQLRHQNAALGPAASPTPTLAEPTPTDSGKPSPSPTPEKSSDPSESSTPDTNERLTKIEIQKTIESLLGPSYTLGHVEGEDTNTGDTYATELHFSVTDDAGTAWITAGLIPEDANYTCQAPRCTTTDKAGGQLMVAPDARDQDKSGQDSAVRFIRPDGRVVEILQQNFNGGNDPVTRAKLPLTDEQAIAFVENPVWDDLAARCQPQGMYC